MNPISLEAQVLRELDPPDVVRAAAAAGFDMAGIWIDPERWTPRMTRDTRAAFAQTGIAALEAEVIRLRGGIEADQLRLIDIAGEIGARHVIIISLDEDYAATCDAVAALAEHAAPAGIRPVFEFGGFSAARSLADARAIVAGSGGGVGILPDPIHLERSGGRAAELCDVAPALIPFAQICDAGQPPADRTAASLLHEARYHRRDLGEGVLPLAAYLAALPPGIPLSNEVRSLAIERRHPDPFARAASLARTMRAWLAEQHDGERERSA